MITQPSSLVLRCGAAWTAIAALLASCGWAAEPAKDNVASKQPTDRLVQRALESELAGHNDQRETLLRQALAQSPNDRPTRWQLGQIRVGDAWLSPGEVQRAACKDERLAAYRRLRETAGPTVDDQVALAQWCRKNKLGDEEQVHWLSVLQLQPNHPDAVKALGLRPYQGMLMTKDQIAQMKERMQALNKAIEWWRLPVTRWRNAIDGHETSPPTDVREKVSKVSDSIEMLGLQRSLWQCVGMKRDQRRQFHAMSSELIQVLADNPHPAGAQCLTWLAVLSQYEDVRTAAAAGLKRHPLDHCVPLLISGLRSPIEVAVYFGLNADNRLVARYSFYQEGPLADVSFTSMVSPVAATPTPPIVTGLPAGADSAALRERMPPEAQRESLRRNAARSQQQAMRASAALQSSVATNNAEVEQINTRITTVLCQVTDLEPGMKPQDWCKWWWQDHNDMSAINGGGNGSSEDDSYEPGVGPRKRVVEKEQTKYYNPLAHSCFAPGTKVWTLTGPLRIEQVKVGDRVLAQDVESGELAYKPVLAVTVRQPTPRLKIGLGSETIIATLGHPFWLAGKGWQLTKQLEVGANLHTLSGGQAVETVEKEESGFSDNGCSHNLVVADFHTYFVGERGILVHDNTPRQPTSALLPGLARQ